MVTRRAFLFGSLLAAAAHAQQLAHAGWRGNSITAESWWKHAAFVRFADSVTFASVAQSLDAMAEIGADSILLPDLQPTATAPFHERFGTEDDLDALLREASARRMHVLLRMPVQRAVANDGEVRFWMNRGIAGFDLGTIGSGDVDAARQLRASLDGFHGERILLARTPGSIAQPVTTRRRRKAAPHDPVTLHVLSKDDVLTGATQSSVAAVEITHSEERADNTSALLPLLLTQGAPIIASEWLSSPELRTSVHDVFTLHATRTGKVIALSVEQPAARAWLLQGRTRHDALLLAMNTGAEPLTMLLAPSLTTLGVHAGFLHPLLQGDDATAITTEQITLQPGAAIVGELRTSSVAAKPSGETPAPHHTHRRHRRR